MYKLDVSELWTPAREDMDVSGFVYHPARLEMGSQKPDRGGAPRKDVRLHPENQNDVHH